MGPPANLGTARNRTDLFLKYRKHAQGSKRPLSPDRCVVMQQKWSPSCTVTPHIHLKQRTASTGRLLAKALASHDSENGHTAIELVGAAGIAAGLPPQYVDFKEEIRVEMAAIKRKMDGLKNLHSKAALTHFDDANTDEAEIEALTREITRLFKKCEVRLTRFGDEQSTSEADNKVGACCKRVYTLMGCGYMGSLPPIQVKHNVQRTLALELQKLSITFRKQQKAHLNRYVYAQQQ